MDIPVVADATPGAPQASKAAARGFRRTVLVVRASFYGTVIEETFLPRREVVQIGNSGAMAVPVPEGAPWLARIRQVGHHRYVVTDPAGHQYPLEPGDTHVLTAGAVTLEIRAVEKFTLRRTEDFQWWGSLAWFTVVFAATLLSVQANVVARNLCPWFGVNCPAEAMGAPGIGGSPVTAEYLARLLREDYAGTEDGGIQEEDRELGERENPSFYLPAGAEGPITEMGGAAETAAREIRSPKPTDEEAAAQTPPAPEVAENEPGEEQPPVVDESEKPDAVAEAVTDGDGEEEVAEAEAPAEDHTGWGVQDWYDADDKQYEDFEIHYMLKAASERLRIDPNDPDALSVLSYYQYLAEDYEAAEKTYDKFIGLFPEESAGYNNKALIYKRQGDYEKEEGLYRVALALRPDDVVALNNLAVCLAHQGKFGEATAIMDRLLVLDPDDAYAELHRSKIAAAQGNDEAAYLHLEQALQQMADLDTLHHIEFRQDIRLDPSFEHLRQTRRFHAILTRYYGDDSPLTEGG